MSMKDLRSEFLGDSLFLLDVLCNSPFSGAVHWVAASSARFFRIPLAPRQECHDSLTLTRGHLGDYEFNVTAGGKSLRQMRTLKNEGPNPTLQFP